MNNIRLLIRQRRLEIKEEKERELFMRIEYEHKARRIEFIIDELGSIPHSICDEIRDSSELKVRGLDM